MVSQNGILVLYFVRRRIRHIRKFPHKDPTDTWGLAAKDGGLLSRIGLGWGFGEVRHCYQGHSDIEKLAPQSEARMLSRVVYRHIAIEGVGPVLTAKRALKDMLTRVESLCKTIHARGFHGKTTKPSSVQTRLDCSAVVAKLTLGRVAWERAGDAKDPKSACCVLDTATITSASSHERHQHQCDRSNMTTTCAGLL